MAGRTSVEKAAIAALMAGMGAVAVGVIIYASRWGIGISPDSACYIDTARQFAAGHGLVHSIGGRHDYLTWYPPLYPLMLAMFAKAHLDVIVAARWLSAGFFAATTILSMWLTLRCTRSVVAMAVLGLLILCSPALAIVHARAWSEPPFILLILLGFAMLGVGLHRQSRVALLVCGLLMGAACLTRYAGACLVPVCLLVIVAAPKWGWGRRLLDSLCFLAASGAVISTWTIRNRLLGVNTSARAFRYHAMPIRAVRGALGLISEWFLPFRLWPAVIVVLIAGLVWAIARRRRLMEHVRRDPCGYFLAVCFVFALVYFPFILFSKAFFDAAIALDERILAPMVPPLLILLVAVAHHSFVEGQKVARVIVIAVLGLALFSGGRGVFEFARSAHKTGIGFLHARWRNSKIIAAIRKLPPGTPIYTNAYDAIYVLLDRPSSRLPAVPEMKSPKRRDVWAKKLAQHPESVFVIFKRVQRGLFATPDELQKSLPIEPRGTYADGVILYVRRP